MQFEEATKLVYYKMCIFNKWENKKENVERNHIVDWDIYVTFVNHLDHLKKIFHFWLQIQLKSVKLVEVCIKFHAKMLTFNV